MSLDKSHIAARSFACRMYKFSLLFSPLCSTKGEPLRRYAVGKINSGLISVVDAAPALRSSRILKAVPILSCASCLTIATGKCRCDRKESQSKQPLENCRNNGSGNSLRTRKTPFNAIVELTNNAFGKVPSLSSNARVAYSAASGPQPYTLIWSEADAPPIEAITVSRKLRIRSIELKSALLPPMKCAGAAPMFRARYPVRSLAPVQLPLEPTLPVLREGQG